MRLTRRDFIKLAGMTSAGLALTACGIRPTATPASTGSPVLLPSTIPPSATPSPTPLPPTLGALGRRLGMDVGIEASFLGFYDPNKLPIRFSAASPGYLDALLNFSLLSDGYAGDPAWTDYEPEIAFAYWHDLSLLCQQHNIHLSIDHMYYGLGHFDEGSPVANLVNAPKSQVEAWFQGRLEKFFALPYFTQLNFVNEALWSNDETGDFGWVTDLNPFYNLYGQDYIHQVYQRVYAEAVRTGRKVGKDLRLIYNEPNLETDSPRARYEFDFMNCLKQQLQQETGLERPFDIGMQFHIHTGSLKDAGAWGASASRLEKKTLIEQLQKFGTLGDVDITEFSIVTPDPEQEKAILHTVVEAAIESGVVKSFLMWGPLTPADVPWVNGTMRHLYDGSYDDPKPSYMFDELYGILQSYPGV